MKNKLPLAAATAGLIIFALSLAACKNAVVNGSGSYSGNDNRLPKIENSGSNENKPEIKFERTRSRPETNTIKLTDKLKRENLSKSDYLKLGELLGWNGFCSSDAEIDESAEALNVPFYELRTGEYLLEIACSRAGTYHQSYLFYFINENNLSAKLLTFERIEKKSVDQPLLRYVSYQPTGQTHFDEETKTLFVRHLYSGAARCGWEAAYTVKNAAAVLSGLRAEWNCTPGTEFDDWKKQDLKKLRAETGKTILE